MAEDLGLMFDINPDGTLSNMKKFTEWEVMACQWMNWKFAGQNDKILFITGPVDRVTAIKMNVKAAANW